MLMHTNGRTQSEHFVRCSVFALHAGQASNRYALGLIAALAAK